MIALAWREILPENVLTELDLLVASINALWLIEHDDDGSHSDITAESISITSATWWIRLFSPNVTTGDGLMAQVTQEVNSVESTLSLVIESLTSMITLKTNVGRIAFGTISSGGSSTSTPTMAWIPETASNAEWGIGVFSIGAFVSNAAWGVFDYVNSNMVMNVGRGNAALPNPSDYAVVPGDIADDVYLGIRGASGLRWTEIAGNMLYGHNGVEERGRTTPMGEWEAYTPTWSTSGTQPVLNNGFIFGRFTLVGKTCFFNTILLPGTMTTFGTGQWTFTLPVTALTTSSIGTIRMQDASTGNNYSGWWGLPNQTSHFLYTNASPSVAVAVAAPFAWAAGDLLVMNGLYEIE